MSPLLPSRPRRAPARVAARVGIALTFAAGLAACDDQPTSATAPLGGGDPSIAPAGLDWPGAHRQYGTPTKVGNGRARAYVVYDGKDANAPLEIGVALDERALDGLRAPHHDDGGHEHPESDVTLLSLPPRGAAPFTFVELDWNPGGHEPPGVYDVPHFDFHFWTTTREARERIDPADPQWATLAGQLPPEAERPAFYIVPGVPSQIAVSKMGVHWMDVRSPELQNILGHPELYQPFTKTFIYGSWAGQYVFLEPMITRAHLLAKKSASDPAVRDEVIPISTPAQVRVPGAYPSAYRITWDAKAREYRVALTQLARRG